MWGDRDGELVILKFGSHIEFDDDGSWLDFNVSPEEIFPNHNKLSESEIFKYMSILSERESEATVYTKKEMELNHQKFLKLST